MSWLAVCLAVTLTLEKKEVDEVGSRAQQSRVVPPGMTRDAVPWGDKQMAAATLMHQLQQTAGERAADEKGYAKVAILCLMPFQSASFTVCLAAAKVVSGFSAVSLCDRSGRSAW